MVSLRECTAWGLLSFSAGIATVMITRVTPLTVPFSIALVVMCALTAWTVWPGGEPDT